MLQCVIRLIQLSNWEYVQAWENEWVSSNDGKHMKLWKFLEMLGKDYH